MANEKGSNPKRLRRKTELDEKTLNEMIEKKAYELYVRKGGNTAKIWMTGLKQRELYLEGKEGNNEVRIQNTGEKTTVLLTPDF